MTDTICRQDATFLCNSIPAAVIAINKCHKITIFNKGAESLFRVDQDNMLGQDLRTFFDDKQLSQLALAETLATGAVRLGQEQPIHFQGLNLQVLVDLTPVYDQDQKVNGAMMIIREQVYRSKGDHRLHQLELLAGIGEMAAGAIHEIRNPLTSVSGFVQLLQIRAARLSDETAVGYCKLITDEIMRVNNILSDFLTLAKPQENKTTKINIIELVQDVLTLMYGEAQLFQITLISQLPHEALYLWGNSEKIREVLINLCRNAFQSMIPGGTLTISVSADANKIQVALSDTGHGMTEATIANIFNPFFTTKESGTGLGLAICQRIMRDHNGEITVMSEIGHGSTFTLLFPRFEEKIV